VRPVAVLIGPPGAGKTTVGQELAARLGVAFRDTDDDIVALTGKTIAEIFIDHGESHFRALEAAAVEQALGEHDGVLSLGGGAVLAAQTRRLLAEHTVVFLEVDLGTAAARVGLNRDRPVLALNPRAQLKVLLDERIPLYREVATHGVDTSKRSPAEVARSILGLMAPTDSTEADLAPRGDAGGGRGGE
jgi:shikimate kinase